MPVGGKMHQKALICQGWALERRLPSWLAEGFGVVGREREIFKNKLWDPVQNTGSMASFKSGFAEEFTLELGWGWGQRGGINNESKTDVRLVF